MNFKIILHKLCVASVCAAMLAPVSTEVIAAERNDPGQRNHETTQNRPGRNHNNNQGQRPTNRPGHNQGSNQSHRPGQNQGGNQDNRPGHNQGSNQSHRPGHNQGGNQDNRPGHNQGSNQSHRPGQNQGRNQGNRPGHNQGSNQGNRPGQNQGYNPGNRPGIGRPTQGPNRPGHHQYMVPPPPRPNRPGSHVWSRPLPPPPSWRVSAGVPRLSTILGVAFGTALSNSINYLVNAGYNIDGYDNNVLFLRDVAQLNCIWPDAMLYYNDGYLVGSEYSYSTPYADPSRYDMAFRLLRGTYGAPISVSYPSPGATLTTWYAPGNGYISLRYSPQGSRWFTTLTVGRY